MNCLLALDFVFDLMTFDGVCGVPGCIKDLLVGHPVEYPITAKYDKIMEVRPQSKL